MPDSHEVRQGGVGRTDTERRPITRPRGSLRDREVDQWNTAAEVRRPESVRRARLALGPGSHAVPTFDEEREYLAPARSSRGTFPSIAGRDLGTGGVIHGT